MAIERIVPPETALPTLYVERAYCLAPYAFPYDAELDKFSFDSVDALATFLPGGWLGVPAMPKATKWGLAEHVLEPGWIRAVPLVRVTLPTTAFSALPGLKHYRYGLEAFGYGSGWVEVYKLEKILYAFINNLRDQADIRVYDEDRDRLNEILRQNMRGYGSAFRLGRIVTNIASQLLRDQYSALGVEECSPTVELQSLLFTKDDNGTVHVARSDEPLI